MKKVEILTQKLAFWDKLSASEQAFLVESAMSMQFCAGQTLFSSERECLGLVILTRGALRAYMLSEEGREVTLYRLDSGDVCVMSASCVLKNIRFDVFIDAEMDGDAVIIPSSALEKVQRSNIFVENFILKRTADRFSDVMKTFERLLFVKIDRRISDFLLAESAKRGKNTIETTHEQLAKNVGAARETVSRTLGVFAKKGYVRLTNGQIELILPDKMAEDTE